ncbi:hypothetical protein BJ912DRAFT_1106729 [Pholiota molesta]|nr:hypothetical protein BJ912DRAFT_1106729 [Pholiota molesta]
MQALAFGGGLAVDIITTLLHILAIGLTLLRLYYRLNTSRLGWDDLTAALAVLVDVAYFALLWPFFSTTSNEDTGDLKLSSRNKSWVNLELFFAVVCLCRMSIAIAIARVFPAKEPMRRFTIGLAVLFGLMFAALQITTACIGSPVTPSSASTPGRHQCQWVLTFVHSYLFINIIADVVLVGVPLYKLWRVRLPTRQRRLILGGFAASLVPALGIVVSTVFQLAPYSWEPGRTDGRLKVNYMLAAICLAACNLLVVITFFDNVRRRRALAREQASSSLHPTESCDTSQIRDLSPAPHSNQVPPSDVLTTLVLTEITGAYITVDTESGPGLHSYLTSSSFVSDTTEAGTGES